MPYFGFFRVNGHWIFEETWIFQVLKYVEVSFIENRIFDGIYSWYLGGRCRQKFCEF